MMTQQQLELAVPESAEELVSAAIELADIYSAAAVYDISDSEQRDGLKHIL